MARGRCAASVGYRLRAQTYTRGFQRPAASAPGCSADAGFSPVDGHQAGLHAADFRLKMPAFVNTDVSVPWQF